MALGTSESHENRPEPLYSPRALERMTAGGVHFRRIIRAIEAGELRGVNIAAGDARAHWRIALDDFTRWLESRASSPRRNVADDVAARLQREADCGNSAAQNGEAGQKPWGRRPASHGAERAEAT